MKLALGLLLATLSGPALACDCVRLFPDHPPFIEDLERIAAYYPVAAEGVLERDGQYAWRFRPTREYRGSGKASYRVELLSDCSLSPQELKAIVGKHLFLILDEGHGDSRGKYEVSRCVNLLGAPVDDALRRRFSESCSTR